MYINICYIHMLTLINGFNILIFLLFEAIVWLITFLSPPNVEFKSISKDCHNALLIIAYKYFLVSNKW